jgi:periplasmic protein TonB
MSWRHPKVVGFRSTEGDIGRNLLIVRTNSGASWGETPLSPVRSMLSRSQRIAVRVRRRTTLRWPVVLSLALHLTLFLFLVFIPPTQPPGSGSEPLTMDVIVGEGSAEAPSEPAAPTAVTAAPEVPPSPPVQRAERPPPTPAPVVPPPPPVQQAEIPPPTPVPAPDVPPPPPVRQVEIPPPTPAPAPKVPAPLPPVAQVHPPRAPPQRVAARGPVNPAGAPAHGPAGQDAASRASDANNGAAWLGKLKQWWDQRSFYPQEASQTNEGGNVRVHIVIAADGEVASIEVVQSSGLSVLDEAAVAVFRNAHLPPFPPGTPAQPADVVVTLHYHPADNGG